MRDQELPRAHISVRHMCGRRWEAGERLATRSSQARDHSAHLGDISPVSYGRRWLRSGVVESGSGEIRPPSPAWHPYEKSLHHSRSFRNVRDTCRNSCMSHAGIAYGCCHVARSNGSEICTRPAGRSEAARAHALTAG
jgi:hypothetical protein